MEPTTTLLEELKKKLKKHFETMSSTLKEMEKTTQEIEKMTSEITEKESEKKRTTTSLKT